MTFVRGQKVIAHVTRDYPAGYAQGADDPTAVAIEAEIYAIEGDYGIAWCAVKLSDDRDRDMFPADYAHMPLDRLEPIPDPIQAAAESIAANMIAVARDSGTEPIAFVTGNSYLPAIRSYSEAEAIWQDDSADPESLSWLLETINELLEDANVALEAPEDDNSLYVVDLTRFEYVDGSEDAYNLSDQWQAIGKYRSDNSRVSSVWSSHGHRFMSDGDGEGYASCLMCGAMYQLRALAEDPTRGEYVANNGDEPNACTGDTSMAHGYPGERDEGTPDYPLTVDHNCNCIRCDS